MTELDCTLYVVTGGILILALCGFAKSKRDLAILFLVGFGLYVFKSIFLYFNLKLGLFEDKLASGISIDIFQIINRHGIGSLYDGSIKNNITFHVQSYLNYIPFKLFGASSTIVIITNVIMQSLAAYLAYFFSPKALGKNWAILIFTLLSICPAALNFSFFGLRDIVIYVGMTVYTLGIVNMYYKELFKGSICMFAGAIIALTSRPEMLPMAMIAPLILATSKYRFELRTRLSQKLKIFVYCISFLTLSVVGVIGFLQVYKFVIGNIGITEFVNPIEILDSQANARFSRTQGERSVTGGGSNFLPPSVFQSVPWYVRYIVSVAGMLVVPFPWLLTNVGRILAFSDTIFVLICIYYLMSSKKIHKTKLTSTLGLSFLMAILIFASVVSNGGNALRMRLAIQPFLIFATAIVIVHRTDKSITYEQ